MLKFEMKCPHCNQFADAYTKDSRHMVDCSFCGYKATLIEAIRLRNEKRAKYTFWVGKSILNN